MVAAYPLARPRTGKSRPGPTSAPTADHGKRLGRQVASAGAAGADRFDKQAEVYKNAAATCK
jgi:hypothetical protein